MREVILDTYGPLVRMAEYISIFLHHELRIDKR